MNAAGGVGGSSAIMPGGDVDVAAGWSRAPSDAVVGHLQDAYVAMFVERDRRRVELARIRSNLQESIGVCEEMVDAGLTTHLNEVEMAGAMLRGLISETGRKLLGLNVHCQISYQDLHRSFVEVLEGERRWGSSRGRYRAMSDGELEEDESPRPRLDVRALVEHLRTTYGGEAGEAFRRAQLADRVFTDLSLERARFEAKAGKVELQVSVYGARSTGETYDGGTELELMRFAEVVSLLMGDEKPCEAAVLLENMRAQRGNVRPGMRLEVGKHAFVKTFKGHYRVVMSEALAERLRAFIAEHKS